MKEDHFFRLNTAFDYTLPYGKEYSVYGKVPQFHFDSPETNIELLIKNKDYYDCNISINYVKTCDCAPQKVTKGISLDEWDDKCPHKNQIKFIPNSFTIPVNENTNCC